MYLPPRLERVIRILAVLDSYRPMMVPCRVISKCLREPRANIYSLLVMMRDQGIVKSKKTRHGGFQRARGTTFGEVWNMLYHKWRGRPPADSIPRDIEAKIKAVHYKISRMAL